MAWRRLHRVVLVSAALLAVAGSADRAVAQSASEIAAAKQWFSDGMVLEEQSKFADALVLFQRAMAVKKTPQIVFHVAICELKTGALVEALVDFERAQELARADGNKQVESASASELDALRPRVPKLQIEVKGESQPSSLTLDGNVLSAGALQGAIPVNPGKHQIVAEFSTGKVTRHVTLAEGGVSKVELTAPPSGGAVAPVPTSTAGAPGSPAPIAKPPPAEVDRGPAPERAKPVLPWVLIGGGVVALAGGFYMWKLRGDQIDALDAICTTPSECPPDKASEVDDLEGKGKTYTALGIGFWGLGAAAIATGSVLLLGSGGESKAARVSPVLAPGVAGAMVRARF